MEMEKKKSSSFICWLTLSVITIIYVMLYNLKTCLNNDYCDTSV